MAEHDNSRPRSRKKLIWWLVGLSALMTTTVSSMAETIALLRRVKPECRIVVGGAVMTQAYADQIGADCYSPDAMATVHYAQRLFGE